MRALIAFLLLLTVCLAGTCFAQTQFARAVGGTGDEEGMSVVQTSDGGYAVVGSTQSFGTGNLDLFLVKLSSLGAVEWAKAVDGGSDDGCYSAVQTSDGGYAVVGWTRSYWLGNRITILLKLSPLGVLEWAKIIGSYYSESYFVGCSIIRTTDDGYAVVGTMSSTVLPVSSDLFLIKLSSLGALQWAKTIGGTGDEGGNSVSQTSDSGYVVVGSSSSYSEGATNIILVRFNSSGSVEWVKAIGGTSVDDGRSVIQTLDGGYAIAGETGSFGAGNYDLFLMKLSATGTEEWSKSVGSSGDDRGNSIIQTLDSEYVVAGWTSGFGAGGGDIFLVKFNSAGVQEWEKVIGGGNPDYGYSVIQTSDSGYAVAGWTSSFGAGTNDLLFVKLAADGNNCIGTSCVPEIADISPTVTPISPTITSPSPLIADVTPIVTDVSPTLTEICTEDISETIIKPQSLELSVSPNPFNSSVAISAPKSTKLEVFDINGKKVRELEGKNIVWDGTDENQNTLPNGIYFIKDKISGKQTEAVLMK